MKYAKLGNSSIEVSQLCVGCMSFGKASEDFHQWTLNLEDTEAIVKKALELGINFFDTANTYSHGTSEEYLGRALKNNIAREKVVIGTKVYFNEGHLSKEAINREIDGSLKRLGTDYVDLYIIHRFDYGTSIEETMEALDGLVKAGKVRALGASAMYGYQFMKMQHIAELNGWTKFVSMQNHYNLLYREDERELIPICDETNVARIPYSPLAAGHLSRPTWQSESKRSATDKMAAQKYNATMESDMKIVEHVAKLAKEKNVTMTQIALAWQFAKGVTAPIIGGTKVKYYEDAARSFDVKLTDEDVVFLEECYVPHAVVGAL
ncbi:aldo/keto reductase [Clostridium sp. 19966]|uniref:aldo/keto reductase n=1 Tax=Clostridium sp. 19966 TaxID=2768166 RepID=UPI0028E05E64|nr:aldo/keto reductase [Clostridium sp. 19966]MDT8719011.1 aldo/keto reductase [Clostridium sp. 19966]